MPQKKAPRGPALLERVLCAVVVPGNQPVIDDPSGFHAADGQLLTRSKLTPLEAGWAEHGSPADGAALLQRVKKAVQVEEAREPAGMMERIRPPKKAEALQELLGDGGGRLQVRSNPTRRAVASQPPCCLVPWVLFASVSVIAWWLAAGGGAAAEGAGPGRAAFVHRVEARAGDDHVE